MESETSKQRSRQKRRERALQLQHEKQTKEEEEASGKDDHDESPPRSSKDKPRSKPRKIKNVLFEEDIIDGFAIMSFKTLEELEIVTKKNGYTNQDTGKCKSPDDSNNRLDIPRTKKKSKKSLSSLGNNNIITSDNTTISNNSSNAIISKEGKRKSNISHQHHLQHNNHHNHHVNNIEPPRSLSRDRFSDASTHSGSGQGYLCDVESGDDKASESGSDFYSSISEGSLVNSLPNNHAPISTCVALTAPTPPPSISGTPTPLSNGLGREGGTCSSLNPSPVPIISPTGGGTPYAPAATSAPNQPSNGSLVTSSATLPSDSVIPTTSFDPLTRLTTSSPSPLSSSSVHPSNTDTIDIDSPNRDQNSKKRSISPSSSHRLSPHNNPHHPHHYHNNNHNHQSIPSATTTTTITTVESSNVTDSSSCARSLAYTKSFKSNNSLHSGLQQHQQQQQQQQQHYHLPNHAITTTSTTTPPDQVSRHKHLKGPPGSSLDCPSLAPNPTPNTPNPYNLNLSNSSPHRPPYHHALPQPLPHQSSQSHNKLPHQPPTHPYSKEIPNVSTNHTNPSINPFVPRTLSESVIGNGSDAINHKNNSSFSASLPQPGLHQPLSSSSSASDNNKRQAEIPSSNLLPPSNHKHSRLTPQQQLHIQQLEAHQQQLHHHQHQQQHHSGSSYNHHHVYQNSPSVHKSNTTAITTTTTATTASCTSSNFIKEHNNHPHHHPHHHHPHHHHHNPQPSRTLTQQSSFSSSLHHHNSNQHHHHHHQQHHLHSESHRKHSPSPSAIGRVPSSSSSSSTSTQIKQELRDSEKDRHRHRSDSRGSNSSGHHQHHHHPHHHPHHQQHIKTERDRDRDGKSIPSSSSSLTPIGSQSGPFPKPELPHFTKPTNWPGNPNPLYSPLLPPHAVGPLTPNPGALPHLPPLPSPSSSLLPALSLAPPPPLLAASTPTAPVPPLSLASGMFAPPLPPVPLSLPSGVPPASPVGQLAAENLIRSQQDFLQQDLNNRLLAHQADASSSAIAAAPLPPAPFVRNETHQHQHQHQHLHNHMHQHTYGAAAGAIGAPGHSLVQPTVTPFDKLPKAFDAAGIFRPSILPTYSTAFPSLLPPTPSGASLTASLQGAFQPKTIVPPPGAPMLGPYSEREKTVPPPPSLPKKQGKWCAVHVKVAWEIFRRQQKQHDGATSATSTSATASSSSSTLSSASSSATKPEMKPLEPLLRPPSHLLPPGASPLLGPKPSDIMSHSSLLASAAAARSLPDGVANPGSSLFSNPHLPAAAQFARHSPYPGPPLLNPLGFSGLGMFGAGGGRDKHGLSSSTPNQDWSSSRLHRTPSSFPSWPKSEVDREKEREREVRKEEERERERRGSLSHHDSRIKDDRTDSSNRPPSRPRSRSPLRNGRYDHHPKSDLIHLDKSGMSMSSTSGSTTPLMKLKDDRREDEQLVNSLPAHLMERERMERDRIERDRLERERLERERLDREKLIQNAAVAERAEREKIIHAMEQREKLLQSSNYLAGLASPFVTGAAALPPPPPGFGLIDRRTPAPAGLIGGPHAAAYSFLDRPPVPPPTSLWNPFDKSTLELAQRLDMERERERMAMLSRLSGLPGPAAHLAVLEQERVKEQILREHEHELRRQYVDRLPHLSADRLRAVDPLALGYFPRGSISPMFPPGAIPIAKSNSPATLPPGIPPPLIPSSSHHHSTGHSSTSILSSLAPPPPSAVPHPHDNSPSSSSHKAKGCSPADSTTDIKDKSRDPTGLGESDTHSR